MDGEPRLIVVDREHRRRRRERRERRRAIWARIGRVFGVGGDVVVDGVRYRARSGKGPAGERVYDVIFPNNETVKIRPSETRIFDDLTPCPRGRAVRLIEPSIHPGARVLIVGGGTGVAAARLARLAGPSGGVISLSRDPESTRFARRRYPSPRIGHEVLDPGALRGETSGGFAAGLVFIANSIDLTAMQPLLGDMPRVVASEGPIFIGLGPDVDQTQTTAILSAMGDRDLRPLGTSEDDWRMVLARFGAVEPRRERRPR